MRIVRTPLRISIAGGGTDLPVWSREHGSMFISAAINKYIYITLQRSAYNPKINLRYSEIEEVDIVDEIKHDIIRETLKHVGEKGPVQITSHADIPSGAGLGSSGAFGVAVLHALKEDIKDRINLAIMASRIQMGQLGYPIGYQDQLAAALGGVNEYRIDEKDECTVMPLQFNHSKFLEKIVLFHTGIKHDANDVLKKSSTDGLQEVQNLAWEMKYALNTGDFDAYGEMLDAHWKQKKRRGAMSSQLIDEWYDLGIKNGALGGKLIGAGGGGFLLFYTTDRDRLINNMPLQHEPFQFEFEGSKIIYEDIR